MVGAVGLPAHAAGCESWDLHFIFNKDEFYSKSGFNVLRFICFQSKTVSLSTFRVEDVSLVEFKCPVLIACQVELS